MLVFVPAYSFFATGYIVSSRALYTLLSNCSFISYFVFLPFLLFYLIYFCSLGVTYKFKHYSFRIFVNVLLYVTEDVSSFPLFIFNAFLTSFLKQYNKYLSISIRPCQNCVWRRYILFNQFCDDGFGLLLIIFLSQLISLFHLTAN